MRRCATTSCPACHPGWTPSCGPAVGAEGEGRLRWRIGEGPISLVKADGKRDEGPTPQIPQVLRGL